MTTIAWDGKTLAGDTQASLFKSHFSKVIRLDNGLFVGTSGMVSDACAFREWLVKGGDKPKLEDGFHAIVIEPAGSIYLYDKGAVAIPWSGPFVAIGSGRDYAMTAMNLHLSAADAVKQASIFDVDTNSIVEVIHVADRFKVVI
jgi:ATP-dependent protease HslVU (ClpYQ) peptidase subunit